jgi:hypothetical protein
MATKCFSCDFPYVPSGGICPNCGKDNSVSDVMSDRSFEIVLAIVLFIIAGIIMFSLYKKFTFDEDDLVNRKFILENKFCVKFRSWEYEIYKVDSDGRWEVTNYCSDGRGKWEIKDSKLILYSNDGDCLELRNKKGVYLREDLKQEKVF